MRKSEIGIRDLKTHLSAYLRRVKRGESITITDRGTPIARIVPTNLSTEKAMEALQEAGIVDWSGRRFSPPTPTAAVEGGTSVSDLLLEGRR